MRNRSKTSTAGRRAPNRLRKSTGRGTTLRVSRSRSASQPRTRKALSTRSRASSGKLTTDHEKIEQWVEARGGWPATVARTAKNDRAGILRIDFPGFKGATTLKEISWNEWFRKFDQSNLAFLYQERTASGGISRFFKLVERD
jgi:hypothetical protein